ncbi:MAG: hypothetical protein COV45_04220 [Deltaproteobacteria bacterium CG11_big_fil_rev_8_21_14_0_20_47_16]|nr:MAG: hypothetical protein COV45_04220 [Deltaproteobacteria bacterium CG11_big_fil_rev_8_21_14_0_20_47_16]
MANVSWNKLLGSLNNVLELVPAYKVDGKTVATLKDLFSKANIPQSIDVNVVELTSSSGGKTRELIFNVGGADNSLFRLAENGSVYRGITSRKPALVLSTVATEMIFMGVGHPFASQLSPIQRGAELLYACYLQSGQDCSAQKSNLLKLVSPPVPAVGNKAASNTPPTFPHTKEGMFAAAQYIWNKVDSFIEVADKADSSDSDSDVLKAILKKYAAARPLLKPTTEESALELLNFAQRMLAEFEGSSHLEAFVVEEGKCESIRSAYHREDNGSAMCTIVDTTWICSLGVYSFKHVTSNTSSCQSYDK